MVLLTCLLVVLRAFEVINCSWLWVFGPLWIPLALILSIVGLVFAGAFVAAFFSVGIHRDIWRYLTKPFRRKK